MLSGENTKPIPRHLGQKVEYLQSYTYVCKDGYTTTDDLIAVCLPNGQLSLERPPKCEG